MNFYIGDSIDEINVTDFNIEFSDELMGFVYGLNKQVDLDMSKLYTIDPYADVEIPKSNLPTIVEICNYLLDSSLIQDYEDKNEGIQMLQNLIEIARRAIKKNSGLISIGD